MLTVLVSQASSRLLNTMTDALGLTAVSSSCVYIALPWSMPEMLWQKLLALLQLIAENWRALAHVSRERKTEREIHIERAGGWKSGRHCNSCWSAEMLNGIEAKLLKWKKLYIEVDVDVSVAQFQSSLAFWFFAASGWMTRSCWSCWWCCCCCRGHYVTSATIIRPTSFGLFTLSSCCCSLFAFLSVFLCFLCCLVLCHFLLPHCALSSHERCLSRCH